MYRLLRLCSFEAYCFWLIFVAFMSNDGVFMTSNVSSDGNRQPKQSCLQSFDVKHSTIIRTKDSKNQGAKYLDEADKLENSECLQWCCETTNCTVAIFEEKKKGSCYLFDCEPNGKNICKFTGYSNYTSSILKKNRHAVDLEQWSSGNVVTSSSINLTAKIKEFMPPATTEKIKEHKGSVCGRNQFECRNDSMCIAIYNVCDGVYQCADRSDEDDVGLGCPKNDDSPTSVKSAEKSSIGSDTKIEPTDEPEVSTEIVIKQKWKDGAPYYRNGDGHYQPYQRENYDQYMPESQIEHKVPVINRIRLDMDKTPEKQESMFYHKNMDYLPAINSYSQHVYKHQRMRPDIPDYQTSSLYGGPEYENSMKQPVEPHVPHRNNYLDYYPANNPVNYRNNAMGDINGLVQEVGNGDMYKEQKEEPYRQYRRPQTYYDKSGKQTLQNQYSRLDYPAEGFNPREPQRVMVRKPDNTYDSATHQEVLKPGNSARSRYDGTKIRKPIYQQTNQKIANGEKPYIKQNKKQKNSNRGRERYPYAEPNLNKDVPQGKIQNSQGKEFSKSEILQLTTNLAHTVSSVTEANEEQKEEDTKESGTSILNEINLSELEVNSDNSSQSNGAVLALSLGLVLTGILIVLVGCRLKVVRHRILRRNGRSPLAHDADFLVNGMYL